MRICLFSRKTSFSWKLSFPENYIKNNGYKTLFAEIQLIMSPKGYVPWILPNDAKAILHRQANVQTRKFVPRHPNNKISQRTDITPLHAPFLLRTQPPGIPLAAPPSICIRLMQATTGAALCSPQDRILRIILNRKHRSTDSFVKKMCRQNLAQDAAQQNHSITV